MLLSFLPLALQTGSEFLPPNCGARGKEPYTREASLSSSVGWHYPPTKRGLERPTQGGLPRGPGHTVAHCHCAPSARAHPTALLIQDVTLRRQRPVRWPSACHLSGPRLQESTEQNTTVKRG